MDGKSVSSINHWLSLETKEERTCNFIYLVRERFVSAIYGITVDYREKGLSFNQNIYTRYWKSKYHNYILHIRVTYYYILSFFENNNGSVSSFREICIMFIWKMA